MPNDNSNNGKQRQINGLKHADDIINVKLDLLQSSIEDVHKIVTEFIAPGGVCDTHRQKVSSVYTHVKVQWWFIGVVVVGLITLALALSKSGVAG